MKRKQRGSHESDVRQSLIPTIKGEEDRLRKMIEEARAEAKRIVQDAERQASERVQAARYELPELMAKRRSRAIERLKTQGEDQRKMAKKHIVELEKRARSNMEKAVAHIVSMVWPRG